MTAEQIIREIKELPAREEAEVIHMQKPTADVIHSRREHYPKEIATL
jgi:hypothetical protein